MVNLSSNNSNNINLSGQTQRNVNISTPNTNNVDANTLGNSQRARSWAIGAGLIDGEDYSAKHYAQLAKVSEDIASGAIANIEEIEQQALDSITTGIGEIETAKEGALSLIDTTKDDAIEDVEDAESTALTNINTTTQTRITEIENTASDFEADLTLLTQRAETAATSAESSAINANSSATSADTSATAAATSATNASNSESNAQDSATAAATSASNANQSATSASNSASDAAISASSASTSATNASNYATSSSTSATSAANSASAALISETNAANSANNASDYADNASASATSASTSASNAATSESNASTYASNAYSFASSASLSATNAGNSASSASQSETNAQSYMNSANTYASNASTSATNAATSETNASNSAIAAATSEDNAEIWAEGTDEQVQALGGVHSSKRWSEISASGQINSDWAETDTTSKAYILNKPTNYVTTDTVQNISGRKTFLGEKAIYFKQNAAADKLGFTLYDTRNTEVGGLEYRPNTISGKTLLAINCSQLSGNFVGFRYWASGAINIIAPKPSTSGDYYIPVSITDGTNTVTANNNGTLNISTLLPNITVDQTFDGTSVNAQSGVAISGAGFLQNTATGTNSITILGTPTLESSAINIGIGSSSTGGSSVVIGNNAQNTAGNSIAIGESANTKAYPSIAIGSAAVAQQSWAYQIGRGTNNTANSLKIGFGSSNNYQLLDGTTGLIPDARISSNIARTSSLATVATTGDYDDLTNKPTIPTVNNGTLTIQKNGTTVGTFTANDTNNVTANISVPTSISGLTDDTATYPIDKAESVVDNNSGNLKFWSGTKAQYDAIVTKDANTLYNITDDNTADAYEAYTKSEVDSMFADVDLDNLSNVGKQEIINCVMPSTDQIDFTITTLGQIINMPESGYLQVVAYGSKSSNSFIGLYGSVTSMVVPFADNVDMRGFIPVSKGESIQVYFNNATNIQVYLLKSKGAI